MNKIIELNEENYKSLQEAINEINPNYYISALNLLLWKNYNLKIFYKINYDVIYVYMVLNSMININGRIVKDFYILRPIIKQNVISYNYLIEAVLNAKQLVKNNREIYFDRLFEDDLKYFRNCTVISQSNSAFFYLTKQLKFFPGKKMQKKRNLYNFYLKNYESETRIEIYNPSYKQKVIEYCEKHIIETNGSIRKHEINSIKNLLKVNDQNMSGILIFYKDELVGVTIGCKRNDVYEIFIEKASRSLKGSYQYLLSKNLEINQIETTYIDRQDSERLENLDQSKRSYKPIFVFSTYFVKVVL